MVKAYRCKICGTGYSTTGDSPPPSPNWDDGHVCEMVEVESKLNSPSPPIGIKKKGGNND